MSRMTSSSKAIPPLSRRASRRRKSVKRHRKNTHWNDPPVNQMNKVQIVRTLLDVPMERLYLPATGSSYGVLGEGFQRGSSHQSRVERKTNHDNTQVKQHRSARIAMSPSPPDPEVSLPFRKHGDYYMMPPRPSVDQEGDHLTTFSEDDLSGNSLKTASDISLPDMDFSDEHSPVLTGLGIFWDSDDDLYLERDGRQSTYDSTPTKLAPIPPVACGYGASPLPLFAKRERLPANVKDKPLPPKPSGDHHQVLGREIHRHSARIPPGFSPVTIRSQWQGEKPMPATNTTKCQMLPNNPGVEDFAALDAMLDKALAGSYSQAQTPESVRLRSRQGEDDPLLPPPFVISSSENPRSSPPMKKPKMTSLASNVGPQVAEKNSPRRATTWGRDSSRAPTPNDTEKTMLRKGYRCPLPYLFRRLLLPFKSPPKIWLPTSSSAPTLFSTPAPVANPTSTFSKLSPSLPPSVSGAKSNDPERTSRSSKESLSITGRDNDRYDQNIDTASGIEHLLSSLVSEQLSLYSPVEAFGDQDLQDMQKLLQDATVAQGMQVERLSDRASGRTATHESGEVINDTWLRINTLPRSFSDLYANGIYELPADPSADKLPCHPISVAPQQEILARMTDEVILQILQQMDNLKDLFSMALVRRDVFSVFKRNELSLIQGTLRKMSPTAWELCDVSGPRKSDLQDIQSALPALYLRRCAHNLHALVIFKHTMLRYNNTRLLRPEFVSALSGEDEMRTARFDKAFWRVWTFCHLFGSGKDRENDIVGQDDWVQGGPIARQQTQSSAMYLHLYDFTSVLFDPPEGFGEGNREGLTSDDLDDMTEIWACLKNLLHFLHKAVHHARRYGIFDKVDTITYGEDSDESLLREWTYYILSLGPSAVLELACSGPHNDPESAFEQAKKFGWTDWPAPLPGSSRSQFLIGTLERFRIWHQVPQAAKKTRASI